MSIIKKITNLLIKEKVFSLALILYLASAILLNADGFNSLYNINSLLIQVATFGIVALGMTFAIIGGEFDLSVGSVYSLTGLLVVGLQPQFGLFAALLIAITVALALGLLNGVLVAKAKISAFIVTFGAMIMIKGIALSYSNGRPITSQSTVFNKFGELEIGGVSAFFIIFVFLVIVCHYVLSYTRFGRNIYAIGGNKETAITSGLSVDYYKTMIFILTAFFAGLMGIMMASRLNSGSSVVGDGVELKVIAAVVIGGTHLAGGRGTIMRTLLGVFVLALIENIFNLKSDIFSPYFQRVIQGIILVIVVAFDGYNKKKM